jgi:hypothetical protein
MQSIRRTRSVISITTLIFLLSSNALFGQDQTGTPVAETPAVKAAPSPTAPAPVLDATMANNTPTAIIPIKESSGPKPTAPANAVAKALPPKPDFSACISKQGAEKLICRKNARVKNLPKLNQFLTEKRELHRTNIVNKMAAETGPAKTERMNKRLTNFDINTKQFGENVDRREIRLKKQVKRIESRIAKQAEKENAKTHSEPPPPTTESSQAKSKHKRGDFMKEFNQGIADTKADPGQRPVDEATQDSKPIASMEQRLCSKGLKNIGGRCLAPNSMPMPHQEAPVAPVATTAGGGG